jgi:oxygen-dependent protoporphyrinogen oxidase
LAVAGLRRKSEHGWSVSLSDGTTVDGDAVIIATESWAAEPLIRPHDKTIADALAGIPSSSSATISVAFNENEVGFDLKAFGVLCPLVEGRALMAATYSSTKWAGRAPAGKVLMRGFVGGPHNQEILKRSDEELVRIAIDEFCSIVGLNPFAKPLFSRVFRWHLGMPQYTLGHLDRVRLIEDRCAKIPGFAIAGGSYRGVGVPNCIESGEQATSKVLGEWGIVLAEDRAEEKRYY